MPAATAKVTIGADTSKALEGLRESAAAIEEAGKPTGGEELRVYSADLRIEQRDDQEGPGTFIGYAAVFDELSLPLGLFYRFREKIAHGAFSTAISEDDVRFLLGHDDHPLSTLGRSRPDSKQNTLSLAEDAHGLRVSNELPDTQAARDLATSVKRGDVDQMSFGFTVVRDSWENEDAATEAQADDAETDLPIRTLHEVRLFDVSPVTFPAYPQTSGSVRRRLRAMGAARAAAREDLREAERRWLRLAYPRAFRD